MNTRCGEMECVCSWWCVKFMLGGELGSSFLSDYTRRRYSLCKLRQIVQVDLSGLVAAIGPDFLCTVTSEAIFFPQFYTSNASFAVWVILAHLPMVFPTPVPSEVPWSLLEYTREFPLYYR